MSTVVELHFGEQDVWDLISDLRLALKQARKSAAQRTVRRTENGRHLLVHVKLPLVTCIDRCLKEDSDYE